MAQSETRRGKFLKLLTVGTSSLLIKYIHGGAKFSSVRGLNRCASSMGHPLDSINRSTEADALDKLTAACLANSSGVSLSRGDTRVFANYDLVSSSPGFSALNTPAS